MIPKTFHRIWIGGPEPDELKRFGQTWLDHHPGWTLKTWTDETIPKSRFPDLLRKCVSLSNQADVLRYEIVLDHGGVYIDADFECKKNIEPLIEGASAFAARVNDDALDIYAINNAIVGAEEGHNFFRDLVEGIPTTNPESLHSAAPQYITAHAKKHHEVRLLEKKHFYPFLWTELNLRGRNFPEAYAVHHWSSTYLKNSYKPEPGPSSECLYNDDRIQYAMTVANAIPGWMGQAELLWLAERAMARKSIVEFGSFHGRSAKAMALATPGKVYAVDKWDFTSPIHPCIPIWDSFNRNHYAEMRSGKVVPLRMDTAAGGRELLRRGVRADMVFIDADHSYEGAKKDILIGVDLLGGRGSGGLLCGHDFNSVGFPGVVRAVKELVPTYYLPTNGCGWIWAAII